MKPIGSLRAVSKLGYDGPPGFYAECRPQVSQGLGRGAKVAVPVGDAEPKSEVVDGQGDLAFLSPEG